LLKHAVVRDKIDDLFLGPAGNADPSLGTLVRCVLKSAEINGGKGMSLLQLRKQLATETRRKYDNGDIPRREFLEIVKSLEHTELVSAGSYESPLSPFELGSHFASSLGLIEAAQEEEGSEEEEESPEGAQVPEEKNDRGPIDLVGEVVEDEYLYTDGKRCRVPWSEREKKALKQAVGLWGAKWETILQSKRFGHNFHAKRTGGDLRDAYRRLDGDRRKKKATEETGGFLQSLFSSVTRLFWRQ
jgi:hypothetical protein